MRIKLFVVACLHNNAQPLRTLSLYVGQPPCKICTLIQSYSMYERNRAWT